MHSVLLSLLSLFKEPLNNQTNYDVSPAPFIAIGIIAFLVIAAIIIVIIVFAVKFLKHIRNKNNRPPQ
jgi:hypothetical protein